MTREEKFEKVNKIQKDNDAGMSKTNACRKYNLKEELFDKELIIRLALKDYLEGNNSISFISNKYGINRKSIERRLKEKGIKAKKVVNCYQDAFDIYEKAKNHAKEQRKKERLHSLSVVEQEHRNRSGDDNTISNKTPHVRNLSKKQKSKDGGEDNL